MSNDIKFDNRADKYDEGFEGRFSRRFYKNLVNTVDLHSGYSVLDVGCGTGTVLKRLSQKESILGFGIDVSENMLIEAKKKCPGMKFCKGDCSELPFENNSMDIITACMAYHHFKDQEIFRKEAFRVLKPNGKLYISDPNFPSVIRSIINGALKIGNINGKFYKPDVLKSDFIETGFQFSQLIRDKYVQVLVMQK